jgi:hypothetical protein
MQCEVHTLSGLSIPWFQLSIQDSREDPVNLKNIVPSPLEHAHQVFRRLREIIAQSGADEEGEGGRFEGVSVREEDIHLGARAETGPSPSLRSSWIKSILVSYSTRLTCCPPRFR